MNQPPNWPGPGRPYGPPPGFTPPPGGRGPHGPPPPDHYGQQPPPHPGSGGYGPPPGGPHYGAGPSTGAPQTGYGPPNWESQGWAQSVEQHGTGGAPPPGFSGQLPTPRKNRKPLIITATAATAIVVVIAVVAAVLLSSGGGEEATGAATPQEAAKGYLEALASGDAEKALSYGINEPENKTFLTDEILKKQFATKPITDIQVNPISEADGTVQVMLKWGEQSVDEQLRLKKADDGSWKLVRAAYPLDFGADKKKGDTPLITSLTIAGKPLPESRIAYVFPGPLDLGNTNPYVKPVMLWPDWVVNYHLTADFETPRAQLGFEFTEAGLREAEKPINAMFAECAKSKLLKQPGCPQDLATSHVLYVDGTLEWKAPTNTDKLKASEIKPDGSYTVSGSVEMAFSAQSTFERLGRESGTQIVSMTGTGNIAADPPTFKLKEN